MGHVPLLSPVNAREKLLLGLVLLLTVVGGVLSRLRAVRLAALRAANPIELLDSSRMSGDGDELVDINSADRSELEALPGIGPVLAQRIVDYRQRFGPFRSPDQLAQVPGIGPKRLTALRGLVRAGSIKADSL